VRASDAFRLLMLAGAAVYMLGLWLLWAVG